MFGGKNRKAERGESELLHGLVRLASEIQSGSDLEGIVRAIVSTVTSTFGYRESTVYLVEPDGAKYRAWATVGEHPDYDADVFARPVPSHIWDELLVERHQIGSSFFIDHRRHEWTEEQLYYLPPLPLGPRRRRRVGPGRRPVRPALRQAPPAHGRHRPVRSGGQGDPHARTGQGAGGVRRPRRGGGRERPPAGAARGDGHRARTGARHSAPAPEPEHRSSVDPRPARRLPADHDDAEADRRLRHHGHPPRRRGHERAGRDLRARRERRADARLQERARRGRHRMGGEPQRGAARQRHEHRPARRLHPGHGGRRAAGEHHRAAERARQGDGSALARPPRRRDLRRGGARAGEAVRQYGGHRHPERAQLRGHGASGDQRRPDRDPQLPSLPRHAEGDGQPGRALRGDVLPPDDGPRSLQDGQRHHRTPGGRRGPARRGRRAAFVLPRVGLSGPLRWRGVRHDPAANRAGRGGDARRTRARTGCADRRRRGQGDDVDRRRRLPRVGETTATACWRRPTPPCCAPRRAVATGSVSPAKTPPGWRR